MPGARLRIVGACALWAGVWIAAACPAQQSAPERAQTIIVTLDQDRLFLQSAFGQRIQRELERDRTELAAENRRIEAELIAEEKDLTQRRSSLSASEFAPLAEAFDTKVQRIRQEQTSKSVALQRRLEEERQSFLNAVGPVLVDILRQRGAVAIIDRDAILLSFEGLDITDDAIAVIDRQLGDGEDPPADAATAGEEPEGESAPAGQDPERDAAGAPPPGGSSDAPPPDAVPE